MRDVAGEADTRFMAAAIRLGAGALGQTWPNPAVGAIIVRNGIVTGSARTGRGGRPHAESRALEAAGGGASGATLYVSLEPCAHHGKTPPCAEAIIAAGIARVVVGAPDPDRRVSGRGIAALEGAGIPVEFALRELAERCHAGHLTRMDDNRPWVTLKLAVSADGMIGREGEGQVAITSECASRHVHALRSRYDGILVGSGTVKCDDPQLTCRLPGLVDRSPARIVLDTDGSLDETAKVFARTGDTPVFRVVAEEAAARLASAPAHVDIVPVPASDDGLDLDIALRRLAERGLTRILAEGGAKVAAALLKRDLADEIILFRSPAEIGPGGISAFHHGVLDEIDAGGRFRRTGQRRFGPDRMIRYTRAEGPRAMGPKAKDPGAGARCLPG